MSFGWLHWCFLLRVILLIFGDGGVCIVVWASIILYCIYIYILDYPKVSRASTVSSSASTYRDSSMSESTLRNSSASYVTIHESQGQSIPQLADGSVPFMNGNAGNGEVKFSAGELSEVNKSFFSYKNVPPFIALLYQWLKSSKTLKWNTALYHNTHILYHGYPHILYHDTTQVLYHSTMICITYRWSLCVGHLFGFPVQVKAQQWYIIYLMHDTFVRLFLFLQLMNPGSRASQAIEEGLYDRPKSLWSSTTEDTEIEPLDTMAGGIKGYVGYITCHHS